METGVVGNGVCSSELVDGSRDVWSCKESDSASADHLVVMVNGILGSVADWKFAAEQFVKLLPDKVFVHFCERNVSMLTLDGVDVMGQRLVEEVLEVIQRKPNLKKISFVAHSMGGLVARYAIGKLYRALKTKNVEDSSISGFEEDSRGTIGGLEAMNFVIVATPHLGSRGNRQFRIHLIFRRTGRHLFLINFDEGKPPLLKRMIEDYDDCYFMSALCTFKRRMLYSNVGYDHIVGWRTSSIRRNFEQPKWEDTVNENYPHVVYEEHCKACDAEESKSTSVDNDNSDKLEEELVTGLSCMSWEKVDVSFQNSRQRFAAYSIIQIELHTVVHMISIFHLLCLP
ncbi:hypothetical protein UlMin_044574 [Ulmus minor]